MSSAVLSSEVNKDKPFGQVKTFVDKSDDLHDKLMRVEVLEHYNNAGNISVD